MKSYLGYFIAFICSLAVILYSIYFYSGYKETHLVHFSLAAMIFPIIGNSFQQHSMFKDLFVSLFMSALVVGLGYGFWGYQDTLNDFSFENDFLWSKILVGSFAAFIVSQIIKAIIGTLKKEYLAGFGGAMNLTVFDPQPTA